MYACTFHYNTNTHMYLLLQITRQESSAAQPHGRSTELLRRMQECNKDVYGYIEELLSDWESEGSEIRALRRQIAKLQV